MSKPCPHGFETADNTGDVIVKPDGTTTCCGAFTSIFMDDESEYCKCCYRTVTGYEGSAVFDMPVTLQLPPEGES